MYSLLITTTQVFCIVYLREVINAGSHSDAQKFEKIDFLNLSISFYNKRF